MQRLFYIFILALLFFKSSFAKIILEAKQINNYKDGQIEAKGNVIIKSKDITIYTEKLIYIKSKEKLIFPENVVVKSKNYTIEAKRGWYKPKEKKGEFFNVKLSINYQYFLKTKKLVKEGDFIFYEDAKFSSCPFNQYDWYIFSTSGKARKNDYLHAKNVVFYFCYVPFLYIPYFAYPISKRKSGILPITIGQDMYNSYTFKIPIYWVINRTSDATFTLDYREKQGKGLSIEYRKKFSKYTDIKLYTYYFKDNLINEVWTGREEKFSNRWLLKLDTNLEKFKDTKVFFYLEIPSDKYFYEDIYASSTIDILNFVQNRYRSFTKSQFISLTDKDDFSLEVNFEYLYDLTTIDNKSTLQRLPEIRFYWKEKLLIERLNLYYDFLSVNTNFYREKGVSGIRSDNTFRLISSLNFNGIINFLEISPRTTFYTGLKDFSSKNANRNLISIKDRLSMPFYKNFNTFTHSIIPVIKLSYVNKINQGNLPIFDKEDRIEALKDIDFYLYNILSFNNQDYFRWEIGTGYTFLENFYIGDTPFLGHNKPITNNLILKIKGILAENNILFDRYKKQITRSISSLSLNIFNKLRYSINHSYDKGENITQSQLVHSVSTSYKLFKLSGSIVQNLEEGYTQQRRATVIFDRKCWNFIINYIEDYNKQTNKTFKTITATINILRFKYALPFIGNN